MALVKTPIDFSILEYTPTGETYIATANMLAVFKSKANMEVVSSDLSTALGSLYEEYDVNPYNYTKGLKVVPESTVQAIAHAIESSNDPVYSSAKNVLSRFAALRSGARCAGSLVQTIGLNPTIIKDLSPTALDKVGATLADRITKAVSDGIQNGVITHSFTKASPADLDRVLSAATNPAVATHCRGWYITQRPTVRSGPTTL